MTTLFVSDLHLSKQRTDKLNLFKKLMEGPARDAEAFYILGDLYESFWIGCDDMDAPNQEIISILRSYSDLPHTKLFIMRGNRDFHLNRQFEAATGCQLIDDPTIIKFGEESVLLMHGDTLCTDDAEYQSWRRFITNPLIIWIYSIMPLFLRKIIAHRVRSYTAEVVQDKPPEIIDVSETSVSEIIQQYNVKTLIHGHTHRQGIHNININGATTTRIVLGDWYDKDCVLIHTAEGFRFERVENMLA